MAIHQHAIEAAQLEVQSILNANSVGCPHVFGERGRAENGAPPRYVWTATHLRDRHEAPTGQVDQPRSLFVARELCFIDCWGKSFAQASAMRNNLIKAMQEAEAADLAIEGGEWIRPGTGQNQLGELFRFEVSIRVPFFDGWIDIETLEEPAESTAVVARWDADIYRSPDIDTDGTESVFVTTANS
jgi:hypothetical protein